MFYQYTYIMGPMLYHLFLHLNQSFEFLASEQLLIMPRKWHMQELRHPSSMVIQAFVTNN